MKRVVIAGAGLSGLTAAYHLEKGEQDVDYIVLEKEVRPGGYCKTVNRDGFLFDMGLHCIWGDSSPWVKNFIEKELGVQLEWQRRRNAIHLDGILSPYPYQVNLKERPDEEIYECLLGFLNRPKIDNPDNFEDWILTKFGDGIAKHFMFPYNMKFWKLDPKYMTADWCWNVPTPTFEQMLKGSLIGDEDKFGGNATIGYPTKGGIETLIRALNRKVSNVITKAEIVEIDTERKIVYYSKGNQRQYDYLISSIPLHKLGKTLTYLPYQVSKAFSELKYNVVYATCIILEELSGWKLHWVYYPDRDTIFHRINFLEMLPGVCINSRGSLIVETSVMSDMSDMAEQVSKKWLEAKVIDDLYEATGLRTVDAYTIKIDPAYIIFDKDYSENITIIQKYLKDNNILTIGRYGNWEYSNMSRAMENGRDVAEKILSKGRRWKDYK